MTSRSAWMLRFAALVAAMTLVTLGLAWWAIAVAGFAFAMLDGRDSAAWEAGASAATAWALILAVTVLAAGVGPVAILGGAFGVPPIALPILSVLFAAGLAWSSAAVGLFIRALFGVREPRLRTASSAS